MTRNCIITNCYYVPLNHSKHTYVHTTYFTSHWAIKNKFLLLQHQRHQTKISIILVITDNKGFQMYISTLSTLVYYFTTYRSFLTLLQIQEFPTNTCRPKDWVGFLISHFTVVITLLRTFKMSTAAAAEGLLFISRAPLFKISLISPPRLFATSQKHVI